ncbi:ATP-binding protein [Pelagicoccus albus]|uniref:Sensory/regulatory protein RpfC n=1 Tax=Pelagicoccus albus TaxID=415222 RepID=A0A7X1B8R1_9BACT|nr:ATP-binding protein [Pelagicoccus albus]MBC2607769.1 response regulator [Pelagicoccus albus]
MDPYLPAKGTIASRWRLAAFLFLLQLLLVLTQTRDALSAPRQELGLPELKIHETEEIGSNSGGRFVSVDTNGRILFSSDGQLFAYDGTEWNQVSVSRRRQNEDMMSVREGPDGRLYVGGIGYWGRLKTDQQGRYQTEFLSSEEEQNKTSIEGFKRIEFCGGSVFFSGLSTLVRWSPQKGSTIWEIDRIDCVFTVDDETFVASSNAISRVEGDKLIPLVDLAPIRIGEGRFQASAPWTDGRIALYHNKWGLVLFDGKSFENISDGMESNPTWEWVKDMKRVDSETLALTTADDGICLLDSRGEIITTINQKRDYRFGECGEIAIAPDKSIWVCLSDGVAQILSPLNTTFIDERFGVPMNYFDMARLGSDLLLASSGGLYLAEYSATGQMTGFKKFEALQGGGILKMLGLGDRVLASSGQGIFLLQADKPPEKLLDIKDAYKLHKSTYGEKQILTVSTVEKLYITELLDDRLTLLDEIEVGDLSNKILDDARGDIWLERGISKIGRIHIEEGKYQYSEYGIESGLTSDQWISIWRYKNEVLFSTRKGPLRFDRDSGRFRVATDVANLIPESVEGLTRPAFSPSGDLWVLAEEHPTVLRLQKDGSFLPDPSPFEKLGSTMLDEIIFEEDGVVWITSSRQLIRIDDTSSASEHQIPPPSLVSILNPSTGGLLYHYNLPNTRWPQKLAHSDNSIQLHFTTPFYQQTRGIKYQYRLNGYSNEWSDPTSGSLINLERIPSGKFTFEIRGLIGESKLTPTTAVPIQIGIPLYKTWPAYFVYITIFVVSVWVVVLFRHNKLMKRQTLLEEKVRLQTKALREKNIQLHGAFLNERELKKKAEKANKAKSEFLAMVSHEIRTPLNCIIGMADNLLGTPLERDQAQMSRTIHSSGKTLVTIISDILDFSKIEAGKIEFEREPYSPKSIIDDVFNLFIQSCKEKNLSLKTQVGDQVPEVAIGDSIRIKQILINLVGNALKFTETGGIRIRLETKKSSTSKPQLLFTVQDTGVGIASEDMDELFKTFSQLDSSNTRKYGGTGLGLAICKKLVTQMNGNIGVSSELGQGSTFSFAIELVSASEEQTREFRNESFQLEVETDLHPQIAVPFDESQTPSIALEPRDVLLVEDNPINQQVTAMMLRRIGYTCDIVGNGDLAIETTEKKNYKVILMDIQMPGMDGFQCARKIRESLAEKTPPIIAVTAKSAESDRAQSVDAGMCCFLTKPLERPTLKKAIDKSLSAKSSPPR